MEICHIVLVCFPHLQFPVLFLSKAGTEVLLYFLPANKLLLLLVAGQPGMMGMDQGNPGMGSNQQGGGGGPSGMQQQQGDFGMMQQQQRMIRPGGNMGQQGGLRQVRFGHISDFFGMLG